MYISTNLLLCALRSRAVRAVRSFQCSGRSERSKSPRARSGPLRAAQNRSEPLRAFSALVAQNAQNRPGRAQGCSELLRIAQSRSESPRAVARSCSRNRSGSHRARPALLSGLLVAACARSEPPRACSWPCARSEPLRACSWPPVRAQSLLETACALEIDAAVRACSASPLRSNFLFEETVRKSGLWSLTLCTA